MVSISKGNNKLKTILVSMMQGGGFEKLQFDKVPICSTVPIDAVVFKAEQPIVHPKELKRNSFSPQCNPGKCCVKKKKKKSIDCFVYIKFPLGIMD